VTSLRREGRAVEEQRGNLSIKAPSIEANVLSLSGGNQQKVLLTRALINDNVRLLLAEEPTQGVDVGARAEIYRILRQVAGAGAAVVIVSSDTRELEGLCDRVAVFSAGHVVAELRGGDVREDAIAHAMMTSTRRRQQAHSAERSVVPRGRFAGRAGHAGTWLRDLARGDLAASAVLAVAIIAIALYTQAHNSRFLSDFNLSSLTVLIAALAFISFGQECVILTGGIDLSVGSVVALSTLMLALLVKHGWPTLVAIAVVLVIGSTLGWTMGAVIHYFEIQPFIVTLAGMFLARGLCYAITVDAVSITRPGYVAVAEHSFNLPGGLYVTTAVLIALVTLLVGLYVLHYTRLGRNVYAIGGNAQSALLMGLPVARTRIAVYTISGFCSALGGVLLSFYMLSGSGSLAVGMELDAIAAVVIGGTLLTGGTGYLAGTVLGVLVLGLIQTLINFQGTLSSWWTRIVIGALLFAFILLQRLVLVRRKA
jgi:simple sugar transport system permease protein